MRRSLPPGIFDVQFGENKGIETTEIIDHILDRKVVKAEVLPSLETQAGREDGRSGVRLKG